MACSAWTPWNMRNGCIVVTVASFCLRRGLETAAAPTPLGASYLG